MVMILAKSSQKTQNPSTKKESRMTEGEQPTNPDEMQSVQFDAEAAQRARTMLGEGIGVSSEGSDAIGSAPVDALQSVVDAQKDTGHIASDSVSVTSTGLRSRTIADTGKYSAPEGGVSVTTTVQRKGSSIVEPSVIYTAKSGQDNVKVQRFETDVDEEGAALNDFHEREPVVPELTGQRAARAKEILAKRALRTIANDKNNQSEN